MFNTEVLHYHHAFFPTYFHVWNIPFIFLAGLIGESYGSLVGGGSLITQPALLLLGVPLQSTLAIDAAAPLATEAGILSETYRSVLRNKKLVLLMAIPSTLGGIVGTWLLLTVSPGVIKYLMVASVFLILLHGYATKNKSTHKQVTKTNYVLLFIFLFIISIYTIFIGLGEGTFGRIAVMSVLGLSFMQSQGIMAASKMPARAYSLVVTSFAGLIVWPYLLTFWCSNFLAGKYATKFAKKVPDAYMKTLLTILSLGFVIYLLAFY